MTLACHHCLWYVSTSEPISKLHYLSEIEWLRYPFLRVNSAKSTMLPFSFNKQIPEYFMISPHCHCNIRKKLSMTQSVCFEFVLLQFIPISRHLLHVIRPSNNTVWSSVRKLANFHTENSSPHWSQIADCCDIGFETQRTLFIETNWCWSISLMILGYAGLSNITRKHRIQAANLVMLC